MISDSHFNVLFMIGRDKGAIFQLNKSESRGTGTLPYMYMGYIGVCSPRGGGFSAILDINWVSKKGKEKVFAL